MSTEQKSQLQRANEVLTQEIYVNVTTSDRQAALIELKLSMFTVVGYLKGRGQRLDTALKLIDFFRKRIEKREAKIAS